MSDLNQDGVVSATISALTNPKTPQDYEAQIVLKDDGIEYHHGGHVAKIADEPETESQRKVLADAREVFESIAASSLRFSDAMIADALNAHAPIGALPPTKPSTAG